jgi:hypothetical protein
VEVYLQGFLTLTIYADEWLVSHPGCHDHGEKVLITHLVQGLDSRASAHTEEAKYLLFLLGIKAHFLSWAIIPPKVPLVPEFSRFDVKNGESSCCQHQLCSQWVKLYIKLTSLASITVPTPTVKACLGTFDISFPKKRALASRVSWANVFTLVLDTSDDPGSLKAICPSGPIPNA